MQKNKRSDKRKSEILGACRELYLQTNFKEITIKQISAYTSFSRPSIYNYFSTRESIFLEIFREEYALWCDDMDNILKNYKTLNAEQFSKELAQTLGNRPTLLKLLSMNIYDLEENCTLEDLTNFKREYKRALDTVRKLLHAYFPQMKNANIERFVYIFFPFMFGLYPYTNVTPKQNKAMNAAGIVFPVMSIYDYTYQTVLALLNSNLNE